MKKLVKFIPLAIIVALMIIFYLSGITDYLSYEMLQQHRRTIVNWVETHYILAPLAYTAFYLVATAISLPGATILTITGGFLFGQPGATIYTVIGATIGACIIFLVAKTAFGAILQAKAKPFLKKMEEGFHENQISYLFFLRLVPLFPFWLVNIAPAFFNVSLITYAWTTFIGIIPGAFVYTQAGTGLGAILDSGQELTIENILNIQVKIALIALAIFALIPILVKKLRKKSK